jgi:hypothetical protein
MRLIVYAVLILVVVWLVMMGVGLLMYEGIL